MNLLEAFVRGHGIEPSPDPLSAGRAAGLSVHRFKRKSGPPRVTKVLGLLKGLQPQNLLDIGPGRGAFLWPLVATFPDLNIECVDRLDYRVTAINAVRSGGVERVHARIGDVTALEFEDNAFDVCTILEVLEHLEDPYAAARELLRVGRRFVIASVPSKPDDNPQHIQLFSADGLANMFIAAGARRIQMDHVLNHRIAIVNL